MCGFQDCSGQGMVLSLQNLVQRTLDRLYYQLQTVQSGQDITPCRMSMTSCQQGS